MLKAIVNSLASRLALAMVLTSLIVAAALSPILYRVAYEAEVEDVQQQIDQLTATVKQTAAIATFLEDQQLATEVGRGLLANKVLQGVLIQGISNTLFTEGKSASTNGAEASLDLNICFTLYSPFTAEEITGRLCLYPSSQYIKARASQKAGQQIAVTLAFSGLLILVLFTTLSLLFTRPITSLANHLHGLRPRANYKIPLPRFHKSDEIGKLVNDTNQLLDSVATMLSSERQMRREMEMMKNHFRLIFEQSSSGIALLTLDGKLKVFNPAFEKILGDELLHRASGHHSGLADIACNREQVREVFQQASAGASNVEVDIEIKDPQNNSRWLHCQVSRVPDQKGVPCLEVVVFDISERRAQEQLARNEADVDPLTEALNRRAGQTKIAEMLSGLSAEGSTCALLMLDLDKFKPVNDSLGHKAGDQVLKVVVQRLRACIRNGDLIIRWGGDEFLLAIELHRGAVDAEAVANKVIRAINTPIELWNNQTITLGVSVGIAVFPDNGRTIAELIHCADEAMYDVKNQSKNNYCFHDSAIGKAPACLETT